MGTVENYTVVISNLTSCSFTAEQLTGIVATKIATSSVAFGTCLLTLCLMSHFRMWKFFVHRLTIYLVSLALVLSLMYILQVLPITVKNRSTNALVNDEKWNRACKGIAFLLQYVLWVMLFVICWIVIFLVRLTRSSLRGRSQNTSLRNVRRYNRKALEVTGITLALVLPLTFLWVPFVTDNYGLGGAWCGIVITHKRCSNESTWPGIGIELGIWYAPAVVTAFLCSVGMVVVLYHICRFYFRKKSNKRMIKQLINVVVDGIPLFLYLIIFNIINVVDATNLLYDALSNNGVAINLWIMHGFFGPSRALFIPFAFIFGQLLKRIKQHCFDRKESTTTVFIVSTEWTEVDPLIIKQECTV